MFTICSWSDCPTESGVTFDSAGNLYSSTSTGGSGLGGTAFQLSSGSWAFQLLYSFTGETGPILSDLIFDQAGNIYGTTALGGVYGGGTVFKLTPSMGGYTCTSLHDFLPVFCCSDGNTPQGTLLMDANGNLYGTTVYGGSGLGVCETLGLGSGLCGVIFKITP